MNIGSKQIKAARNFLGWNQSDLAKHSGLTKTTIVNIENSLTSISPNSCQRIYEALTRVGIAFIGDNGVILGKSVVRFFHGDRECKEFFDFVYDVTTLHNSSMRISGYDEMQFRQALGNDYMNEHHIRMTELDNISMKVLTSSRGVMDKQKYASYKSISEQYFRAVPCFIFNNYVAHILWNPLKVIMLEDPTLAESFAKQFDFIWSNMATDKA